jgi:hypothetical protein
MSWRGFRSFPAYTGNLAYAAAAAVRQLDLNVGWQAQMIETTHVTRSVAAAAD